MFRLYLNANAKEYSKNISKCKHYKQKYINHNEHYKQKNILPTINTRICF